MPGSLKYGLYAGYPRGGGSCLAGTAISCDDGNVCTTDSCNVSGGCIHANNTRGCDDGDFQTCNDVCSDGACGGDPNLNGRIDSFKYYRARAEEFTPLVGLELDALKCYSARLKGDLATRTATLSDQCVASGTDAVMKPASVCRPVSVDGREVLKSDTSLECFQIREQPRFAGTTVTSETILGSDELEVRQPAPLCVPAGVSSVP